MLYRSPTVKETLLQTIRFLRKAKGAFDTRPGNSFPRAPFLVNSPKLLRSYYFKKYCAQPFNPELDSACKVFGLEEQLQEFRALGITKIEINTSDIDLLDKYLVKEDNCTVPFEDDFVSKLYNDYGIIELVSAYYGRQAKFREEAHIVIDEMTKYKHNPPPSDIFHSDSFRQVSVMILLNDITSNDIHMEYCEKSHLTQQQSYVRQYINQEQVRKSFNVKSLTGSRGSCYIFDTEGLHRGLYKEGFGIRRIFHHNFHPGTYKSVSSYNPLVLADKFENKNIQNALR